MDFFEILFKFLCLLLISGVLFSFLPKITYTQVSRLLTYHNYKSEALKKRFTKVIRVYLILGMVLGIVFSFLLSPIVPEDLNEIPKDKIMVKNHIELFGLSFGMSFLLIIILRISILLNKSNIVGWILPKKQKRKLYSLSMEYDYDGLRKEVKGFLFSIFLTFLLGVTLWFFYNLIFNPKSILSFSLIINYDTLLTYVMFLLGFIAIFVLITWIGELILHFCKVHPKCIDKIE